MKLKISILLLLFYCANSSVFAQKSNTRTIRSKGFVEEVSYLERKSLFGAELMKTYYWIEAGHLHQTQGDYNGQLLHGAYAKTDQEGNLIEKGSFKKGLKDGTWSQWETDGKLLQRVQWKKGALHGKFIVFENGKPNAITHYKQGLKHGREFIVIEGGLSSNTSYKNGKLVESNSNKNAEEGSTSISLKERFLNWKKERNNKKNPEEEDSIDESEKSEDENNESEAVEE